MMVVEIFIFDGDSCLSNVGRKIFDLDRRPVLFGIDFVEKVAVSI